MNDDNNTDNMDNPGWEVHTVPQDADIFTEVHVVPQEGDLPHVLDGTCLCEPTVHEPDDGDETDAVIYVHKVVYYN